MQTGGGFDLTQVKRKSIDVSNKSNRSIRSNRSINSSTEKNTMGKTGDSFLPDISVRPGSKRKINFLRPS